MRGDKVAVGGDALEGAQLVIGDKRRLAVQLTRRRRSGREEAAP